MHMSKALACIIQMANTIFLRARTIIDIMQQMSFRQQRQGAEDSRAVNSRQGCFQICQTKSVTKPMTHLTPDQQSYSSNTDACIVQNLFVGDFEMHCNMKLFLVMGAKLRKKIVPLQHNTDNIMTQEEKTKLEERIVDVLKTVYDPEIPVNIYDLGMIYKIDVQDDSSVDLDMTFTAPNCPAADFILEDVRTKVESVEGITSANVNLVFEPAWDQSMMTEEARVELGFD